MSNPSAQGREATASEKFSSVRTETLGEIAGVSGRMTWASLFSLYPRLPATKQADA